MISCTLSSTVWQCLTAAWQDTESAENITSCPQKEKKKRIRTSEDTCGSVKTLSLQRNKKETESLSPLLLDKLVSRMKMCSNYLFNCKGQSIKKVFEFEYFFLLFHSNTKQQQPDDKLINISVESDDENPQKSHFQQQM